MATKTAKKKTTDTKTRNKTAKSPARTRTTKVQAKTRPQASTPELLDEKVAVYGVYPGSEEQESGVQALIEAGFSSLDIKASAIEPVPVLPVLTPEVVDCEPEATVMRDFG